MPHRPRLPSVLAVVVTHNGRSWLRECLTSLNVQTYPNLDVLVVDDASPDYRRPPHLKRVAKRHLRRRRWAFLRTRRPLGFGGAINWALGRARTDADLLLFMHDDAALDKDAVERMVERLMAEKTTAIVGPKIVAWDDPTRLEEVGMAVDRFGYPYKGLEEDEIDIGQHDTSSEVFFVTSTCMLVRADLFRQLKGWDSRMKAYSEDLDLCWRARVLGHAVRFEPAARARHAIALARGERRSRFTPPRYYSRRNRLRTLMKNASAIRLLLLLPLFLLLTLAEMVGFIVLRQPGEIINLARALGWNVLRLPQTIAARTRVQLNRKVPDRRLTRLQIRETSRLRFYVQHQAGRLEEAWGRRADFLATRSTQARALGRRMTGWPGVVALVVVIALFLAFRDFIWEPPASVGELLPYPDRITGMWRAFFSPWRGASLGEPGPTTPAFVGFGIFPILTFGAMGAAQKLLLATLAAIAFIGAYRLVSGLVDPMGRVAAGLVYVGGGMGYAGVREGALGALVFSAAAPFALGSLLKLTGWERPAGWDPGREVARLVLAAAVSASLVPGSLFIYGAVGLVMAGGRAIQLASRSEMRTVVAPALALLGAWGLLLPWSATWAAEGGPLNRLMSDETWEVHGALFAKDGMLSVLLGQTPEIPVLMGLALPLLGVIAVLVGEGQRRRVALAMWGAVVTVGLLTSAFAAGWIRPFVATPTEAGVVAAAAFAALAGLAVGAFRLDLPRRELGIMQGVAVAGVAASIFLLVVGAAPAVWGGDWSPGVAVAGQDPDTINEISEFLGASSGESSDTFRALWVGRSWTRSAQSAARSGGDLLITGPRGQELSDLFEKSSGPGESEVSSIVASIESGGLDTGGALLGAFDIKYIVLERSSREDSWLRQRDLEALKESPDYVVLANVAPLASAGVYEDLPPPVSAVAEEDPALAGREEPEPDTATRVSPSRYTAASVSGPGVVFVPQNSDDAWAASVGPVELKRTDGGWGNAFSIPSFAEGDLTVRYPRSTLDLVLLIVVGLAWAAVLGACFSSKRPVRRVR